MDYQFVFRHIPPSAPIESYAKEKLKKMVRKFVTKPVGGTVTFSKDAKMYSVHYHIFGGDHFDLNVTERSADMYAAIDLGLEKISRQMRRRKERIKSHHSREFEHHNTGALA